jgi:hypothetical protein
MADPRTKLDVLYEEVLGEVDRVIGRVEALREVLPKQAAEAEASLLRAAEVLSQAGDQYRAAVDRHTQVAQTELTRYLEQRAGEVARQAGLEFKGALHQGDWPLPRKAIWLALAHSLVTAVLTSGLMVVLLLAWPK